MKKILDFFRKHKLITILSTVVLVAAISLIAVSIALWDETEDEKVIYQIPENPAEKYLEYYVMVPNTSSESGYDYYPLTRIPDLLKNKVEGLAVARYDGYATEVEIPSKVEVTIGSETKILEVKHVLRNYTVNVNNGLVDTTVESVVLPETITYVEPNALAGLKVYVKGGTVYHYENRLVSDDELKVKDRNSNEIDTLIKKNGYYYSTTSYEKFEIVEGGIKYRSTYSDVSINDSGLDIEKTIQAYKLYGLDDNDPNVTFQSESRINTYEYSLSVADLFGNTSGYMYYSDNSYYQYVVVGSVSTTFKLGEKSISLEQSSKYKVVYDCLTNELTALKISYYAGDNKLLLDTNFTDYERYVSTSMINLESNQQIKEQYSNFDESVVSANYFVNLTNDGGSYKLTYTPDVVFTDGSDVVNYSLDNDIYLVNVNSTTNTFTKEITKEEGIVSLYTATSLTNEGINGYNTEYYLAFVLPEGDFTYYADFGNGLYKLINLDGLYLLNRCESEKIRILGYSNEELVYETIWFDYDYGYKYDFTVTSDFASSDYLVQVKDLDIKTKSFDVVLDSRLGISSVDVVITASYKDTFNDNALISNVTDTITKNVVDGKVTIDSKDYVNSILMDADILGTVYVFETYEIKVNGIVVYSFVRDSYNELDFYQKEYSITNAKKEKITGSVHFEYDNITGENVTISVNDNVLSVVKVVFDDYSNPIRMNRNYANTLTTEYFAEVSKPGWYVVSVSAAPSDSHIIESSYVYISEAGIIYYSEAGYTENEYRVFTHDGAYVGSMVYEAGSSYISLPTYYTRYGYYVVDKNGSVVATYQSSTGHEPTYSVDTNNKNTNSESEYSIKVGETLYELYPTNTNGILVTHIYNSKNTEEIYLYDSDERIITTMKNPNDGNYKVYVNVGNLQVDGKDGWYNNYFNFVTINKEETFKLVVSASNKELVIVNKSINNDLSTTYESTSKYESKEYFANNILFHKSSEEMYVALINGYGDYTITNTNISFNLPVYGTYLAYFDLEKVEVVRVEGSAKYQISFDGTVYYDMILNISNNIYLEYILTNFSLNDSITVDDTIYIKDELDVVTTHQVTLEAGLYESISFSLDNQRRREGYEVFTFIKGTSNENSIGITLSNNLDTTNYYVENGSNSLPSYESVFGLTDYQTFIGWYLDSSFETPYNSEELVQGNTYYAKILDAVDYIYVANNYEYKIVSPTNGAPISKFDYELDTTVEFKVSTKKTVKEVTVGSLVLTPNDEGVYSFNTNQLLDSNSNKTVAIINVVVANELVTITLKNGDESSTVETVEYETGTYATLKLPNAYANFIYYYDRSTGIVYTDNKGHLISPNMITKDITLTAAYSTNYYVTVNMHLPDGTTKTLPGETYKVGTTVVSQFPRITDYHYDNITAYITTNGYPVEFDINEYLHTYSFNMPSGNVVINITYEDNKIPNVDLGQYSDTLYVLVPTAMATDVKIYDSTIGDYVSMTRMPSIDQIYQNYVVFRTNIVDSNPTFNTANKYFKVMAGGNESYRYELRVDNNKFVNNTFIIDNLGLENETCNLFNWIVYKKQQNVYTFDTQFTDINPIHGDIKVEDNKVTILSAITIATFDNYQYATFEVIYTNGDVKLSYMVNYTAYGTEENPIIINNGDDFVEFIGNAKFRYKEGLYFKQTQDILVEDANGYEVIYNQEKPFNHTYDGNGNDIIYIQDEIRNEVNNGLFGYIGYKGTVKNFDLYYELLDQNSTYGFETKYYLAPIASINLGDVLNIDTYKYNTHISGNNIRYVGGIVAHNVGTIENCTNNIQINLYNYGASESRILGGITGYNGGIINNCVNLAEITLSGETGREQYVDGLAGMNKGEIINSYSAVNTHNYNKNQSSHRIQVNGVEYEMYKNDSNQNAEYTEYLANGIILNKNDIIRFYDSGKVNVYLSKIEWASSTYSFDKFENTTEIKFTGTNGVSVDIYFKVYSDKYEVYVGSASVYTLEITNPNGQSRTHKMYLNPGNNKYKEMMAVSVDLIPGDTIEVYKNGAKETITINSDSVLKDTSNIESYGSYDIYYKVSDTKGNYVKELYIGSDSHPSQSVMTTTIKVAVADDWYFVDEIKATNKGTYYLESAMLVEYFNGKGESLGTMVYNNAQIYDYNGMNTVIVDILSGTSSIEISRLMLISSRDTSGSKEKWYYAYDGDEFTRIGEPDKSYPDKTYSTGKIALAGIQDQVIYIYAITSGERYATSNSKITEVGYVTGDSSHDVVSYVDVIYPTSTTLGSYRVKYYDGDDIVAIRSYVDGEQVQFLNNVTKMLFESIEEGSGIRRIAELVPDINETAIEISPIEYSMTENNPSSYIYRVNGEELSTFVNSANQNEVMLTSLSLNKGDTLEIIAPDQSVIKATFAKESTSIVSYADSKLTINNNGLFDIYYDFVRNSLYVGDAIVYELVIVDSNGNPTGVNYKMYPNPSPFNAGEVMSIGVSIEQGENVKVRKVGATSYITDIRVDSTVARNENGMIVFNTAQAHDFFLYVNDMGTNIYISSSTVDNYIINYPESVAKTLVAIDVASATSQVTFINTIPSYNDGYTTRVYYLNSDGNYLTDNNGSIYYYEFTSNNNTIPVIPEAKMLKILRVKNGTNIEINSVIVNAIYNGKTLTLSTPYYGYYDISYSSSITDQEGYYLNNPDDLDVAYLEYVLNDGRLGHIKMELNEGKFYVPFDSIIGLNPAKIAVTYGDVTTEYLPLQYVVGNTLNEIRGTQLEYISQYTTFTSVYLYVDKTLPVWDGYFILSDGVYYEMNKASESGNYLVYIAYVKGDRYQVASNPSYSSVFFTQPFTETSITMDANTNGFTYRYLDGEATQIYEHVLSNAPFRADKEGTYEYDETTKTLITKATLGNVLWTLNGTLSANDKSAVLAQYSNAQKLGKDASSFTNLTITSDIMSDVTAVKVSTYGGSSVKATLSVYVGSTLLGTSDISATSTEYTFTSDTPLSGQIVLEYTQTSKKAIYLKSIVVDGVERTVIDDYEYEYYLQSDTPGLLPQIGLVENNNKFFGFYDLAEEVTYYVVDNPESTNPLSDKFTSSAGKHVIIYYEEVNKTYEHTFSNSDDLSYGVNIVDGIEWTITGTSTYLQSYNNSYRFGKVGEANTSLELTSDLFEDVTDVRVNTWGLGSTNATLTVYVGKTQIGDVYHLTNEEVIVTFTSDTPLNGRISLVYSQTSDTAIAISTIAINPDSQGEETVRYDYHYTFVAGHGLTNGGTSTLEGLDWTLVATSDEIVSVDGVKGLHLGTKDKPNTTITLTSATVSNIKRIDVETSGASGTNAILTVSVGGVRLGTVNLTENNTSYAFTSQTPLNGDVELSYNQTSATAIYVKSMTFNKVVNQANVYRNEISYTVNAFYNGYKDRTVFKMGEVITAPQKPSIADNNKYTFQFEGWNYGGVTYKVESGTNKLYREVEGNKVYLQCVSDMTITPVYTQIPKTFTVKFFNADGNMVNTITYNYGEKISSKKLSAPSLPTGFDEDSKFVGWYLTSDKVTEVNNYPVTSDMEVYAKWFIKGVFLVGTIEGDTRWEDQRDGYQFEDYTQDQNNPNNFELVDIFLEAGDVVKPREFKLSNAQSDYWFGDWQGYPNVCVVQDTNLKINADGYYSFYIQKWNPTTDRQEIHVTYQEYMVEYVFDETNDLASGTEFDYPNYKFSLGNSETFELYSEEDLRIGIIDGKTKVVNTPTLEKTINNQKYVIYGWYTRPVNGELVTEVTEEMVENEYRNCLTLYPVYILAGHYLVNSDGSETFIGNTVGNDVNKLARYKKDQTITVNYYNGSVSSTTQTHKQGVSPLDYKDNPNNSMVITTSSKVEVNGNTIKFNQDGLYDIYQDELGKLHIEQYHEVSYRFTLRYNDEGKTNPLRPTINGVNVVSGAIYIQKYGSDLAVLSDSYIYNDSGVLVSYAGWSLEGTYNKPIVDKEDPNYNQKVSGNQTFDIIYVMNSK